MSSASVVYARFAPVNCLWYTLWIPYNLYFWTASVRDTILGKATKGNFEQTVNHLKKKPAQKVLEDDYINGLQEEIKFLEYELKLLKDKEILER